MSTVAIDRLKRLQHKLYERAFIEAHAIVGKSSKFIEAYSSEFENSLPRKFTKCSLNQLLLAFKEHRFVLYGDFHTLRQSQRGLLRLLRAHCDRQNTTRVVLALELIKAKDQIFLDRYLLGSISDQQFLNSISYQNDWGFPWENFKMLLEFAKARNLPVIGINSANGGRDTLSVRDRFAARCLVSAAKKYPKHKIFCLIGEYHLADKHLPFFLGSAQKSQSVSGKTLRILNNVDDYYFKMPNNPQHSSTEYLKLRKSYYCIMNTPPWMKWLSFSMWEDLQSSDYQLSEKLAENDLELENAFDDDFDIDYIFLHFLKVILEFIHVQTDASDLENFHILYSPEGHFINHLMSSSFADPDDIEKVMHRCTTDGAYFISQSNSVLITYLSINNLAETAGQYLFSMLTKFTEDDSDRSGAFFKRIIKNAAGMLSSKILNPRRQFLGLKDYKRYAIDSKNTNQNIFTTHRHELGIAIMKFDKWIKAQRHKKPHQAAAVPIDLLILENTQNYALSRAIGQILAMKLYRNIMSMALPTSKLKRIFTKKVNTKVAAYREILAIYFS